MPYASSGKQLGSLLPTETWVRPNGTSGALFVEGEDMSTSGNAAEGGDMSQSLLHTTPPPCLLLQTWLPATVQTRRQPRSGPKVQRSNCWLPLTGCVASDEFFYFYGPLGSHCNKCDNSHPFCESDHAAAKHTMQI